MQFHDWILINNIYNVIIEINNNFVFISIQNLFKELNITNKI